MHFSKTYTQILEGLPPELRENAIQYRQLKKLINQVVSELSSLGLSPKVLQELITTAEDESVVSKDGQGGRIEDLESQGLEDGSTEGGVRVTDRPRIVYELVEHSDRLEPHLKLWVDVPEGVQPIPPGSPDSLEGEEEEGDNGSDVLDDGPPKTEMKPATNVLWNLHQKLHERQAPDSSYFSVESSTGSGEDSFATDGLPEITSPRVAGTARTQEVVIPLVSDTEFFNNLISALEGMSSHMTSVHDDFRKTLESLSRTISASALPASSSPSFHAHSPVTSHPGSIIISAMQPAKSDLYSWRELFQLYVDAEIFEHVGEVKHGERSSEESEKRLKLFVEQATQRGLADNRKFKSKRSREAFESFIELNLFILNIKKFSEASAEATRKILKKHTKRTALPLAIPFRNALSSSSSPIPPHLALFSRLTTTSLPRTLVQAIGETLLPIIPHVDDYSCLICTSIAFKPIRLTCGHLFCVRCLVKMQKRGQADCPLCRAPVVLTANKSNVDWALLNFMQDWFPVESKEKLRSNEREAAQEEMIELGLNPDQKCLVM